MSFLKKCPCLRPPDTELRVLDYRHSSLEHVPTEVFVFERTLEELYVDANRIKDLPRELFCCHSLIKLSVADNELRTLPHAIGSLIHLEELDISKNGIVSLPDNIKQCRYLRFVEASVNPLGKLPEGFIQLQALTQLYLNDTFLDYLPGSFGRLSKLKILEVRENHLRTVPNSFARLTELERLDLGNNEFTELPDVIGSLTKLFELWVDQNQLTQLPTTVGELKQLGFLDASKNRLTSLPEEIAGCHSMADLHLTTNLLRKLPESIGRLSNLTTLKVDDNRLQSLPFSIGGLVSMSELNVSANDLEDFPPSIGFLRQLRTLYADENYLAEIPPELGSCGGITVLSLRCNSLSFIPDEIGRIPRLRVLNLSDNKIHHLPYSLTRLKELQALWLAENQSTPLVRLQSDVDKLTGQRILTCYLLPQQAKKDQQDEEVCDDNNSFHPSLWEEERLKRQQIHFDFPELPDEEGKLERTPTPYPKEMKHRLQHMRNLALKQLNQPVPSGNGEKSQVKEGRKAERERLGQVGSPASHSGKPTSPLMPERHVLLKADKEKLAKDKERMRHRNNNQGSDQDDGGFLSSSTRKLQSSNTDIPQSDALQQLAAMQQSNPNLRLSSQQLQPIMAQLQQEMPGGILYIKNNGASLPHAGIHPRRPIPHYGRGRRSAGYESDTGYRSDFEMYHKRRHDLRTGKPVVANSVVNVPPHRPRSGREGGYSSDAEAYSRSHRAQYRPLQGYQTQMRHSHTSIPVVEPKPTYANISSIGKSSVRNESHSNPAQQPLIPPRTDIINASQSSQLNLSQPHRNSGHSENHSLNDSYRRSVQLNSSQQNIQAQVNTSHNHNVNQTDQRSSLNRSQPSLANDSSAIPPPSRSSTLSNDGKSGHNVSDYHSLARPERTLSSGANTEACTPTNQDQMSRSSMNGSRHGLERSQSQGDEDDAYKAQMKKAFVQLQKSPVEHQKSNPQLANIGATPSKPPPYKPTPPYTPLTKASPGPAASSTPNLEGAMTRNLGPAAVGTPNGPVAPSGVRSTGQTALRTPRQLFMEQAARGNSPAGSSSPDTAGWNATFDRDVAMYKQEPQSQVSSTDSGYGQGHAERVHDYKPGYPDVPEAEHTPEREPLVVDTQNSSGATHNSSFLQSRESTPGKSPGDSGVGSDPEMSHKNSKVIKVQLKKNPGLGFSISGGLGATGNPYKPDDIGIFVTTVQPHGASNGVLRPGDKILQVNNVDFASIDHNEAVQTLRSTNLLVDMVIERW